MVAQPGGPFIAANVPLRHLIRVAFQLQDNQIVGGPGWIDTDRFDIEAKPPAASAVPGVEWLQMLQSLLADRFKLTTHRETRELPVFALVHIRGDGSLGSGMRPTTCPDLEIDFKQPRPCANIGYSTGFLTLRGAPLNSFTQELARYMDRMVIDRTGLDGRYDIDLKWSPVEQQLGVAPVPPTPQDRPAISTALQEQLGLRLESTRAPVEVLVIDRVEPPTPN
jgi:uncharacterized protein (TIGR03435 family)